MGLRFLLELVFYNDIAPTALGRPKRRPKELKRVKPGYAVPDYSNLTR